ncbi:hypothetical protein H6F63_23540 [Trichocoleus sp. FACHB-40]|nr:hypothetical protein [Trichocoleus sp. FACHB-40]
MRNGIIALTIWENWQLQVCYLPTINDKSLPIMQHLTATTKAQPDRG